MTAETYDIVLGARVSKRIRDRILGEQSRIGEESSVLQCKLVLQDALECRPRTAVRDQDSGHYTQRARVTEKCGRVCR